MVRSEMWSSLPTLGPALPTAPVMPASSGMAATGGYSPLGQSVARDVQQFIAQGSVGSAAAYTPQSQWLALQAARQLQNQERPTVSSAAPVASGPARALRPEQQAFLKRIGPWAQAAAQKLGVSTRSVMAHAALESGWGQNPLRDEDGKDSQNLFGLKATGNWRGPQIDARTTEYVDGHAQAVQQPFRQYADLDATFADYVQLLGRSPRYRAALQTGEDVPAFAAALAQGGYATDPDYANKLLQVSRSIPVAP